MTCNRSVKNCWGLFKDVLHRLETKYVPMKKVNYSNGKTMWLSHKALKSVKYRHKVFRKYKDATHSACKNANLRASKAVHQTRRAFEYELASKIKDDKKSFFAYARCKAKSRATVKPLVGPDGIEVQNPAQITKLFKKQFSSVCTTENKMEVPRPRTIFTGSDYDKLCYFAKAFDKIPHRRLMFVKKHMASMVAW